VPSTYDWSRGFEKRYLKNENRVDSTVRIRESRNRILTVGHVGNDLASGSSVSLEEFQAHQLTSRTDADSLRILPSSNRWIFFNARHRTFAGGQERYSFSQGSNPMALALSSDTFRMINADPDQMTLWQLYQFIRHQEQAGISGLDKAWVKFNTKIAMPFAALIIVLIGVPLSTRKKRSGLALEASISLVIGFLYLGMQKALTSVGYNGMMNPALAAWLPNILFIAAGAALYRSAND